MKVLYWKKQRDRVQQMVQLGVPIDVTTVELMNAEPPRKLRIDRRQGVAETVVFDLETGGTGYIISLSLTVLRGPFAIDAFALALPWGKRPIVWLADPAETNGPQSPYRFPGTCSLVLPRDEVINHYADARRDLRVGKRIEGALLAYGFDSIPDCFVHGSETVGKLGVIDQFGVQHSAEITFWVDRSTKIISKARKTPTRKSLFAERHAKVCRDGQTR